MFSFFADYAHFVQKTHTNCALKRKDRQALKTSATVSFLTFVLLVDLCVFKLHLAFYAVHYYDTCYVTLIGFPFVIRVILYCFHLICWKPNLSSVNLILNAAGRRNKLGPICANPRTNYRCVVEMKACKEVLPIDVLAWYKYPTDFCIFYL